MMAALGRNMYRVCKQEIVLQILHFLTVSCSDLSSSGEKRRR